jgi:hypothetical protein
MPATKPDKITLLCKKLFAAKAEKARLEENLKAVNAQILQLATQELAKLMIDGEIELHKVKGLGSVYMSDEFFASVLKDDRPKLYEWMRNNGHGDIIVDWVFPQTLTAFAKEMAEKNEPLPEFVKVAYIPTAKTRRS